MNTRRPEEEVAGDGGGLEEVPDGWGGEPLRSVQRTERFPVSCPLCLECRSTRISDTVGQARLTRAPMPGAARDVGLRAVRREAVHGKEALARRVD